MCTPGCTDEFVELDLDCLSIPILRVLNQEDHQERDDRGAGVDDQLPRITEAEDWACDHPRDDEANGKREYPWPTAEVRCRLRETGIPSRIAHYGPPLFGHIRIRDQSSRF